MKKLIALFLFIPAFLFSAEYGKVTSQKVANGVYLFRTTPYGDVGMSGNSIAIVCGDGIVVFDSNTIPKTASTVLEDIHHISPLHVKYLINSHWHWDHWGGNEVYAAANPDLQIITQEKTRELMIDFEPKWNGEGLKTQLPQYVASLEKKFDSDKSNEELKQLVESDKEFLEQKTAQKRTYPNLTFTDSLTLWMQDREIQIKHARGITVGDTYVYLPKEKILITGDLMLSPYPYAIGGTYPQDWLKTLQQWEALQPSIIIPGHGDPQHIEFLKKQILLFVTVLNLVKSGKPLESMNAAELASIVGVTDVKEFRAYFLDIFVKRAYQEMDHPLPDTP
jgi:cyclase